MKKSILSDTNHKATETNTWLIQYARNITSQYGEDGIIEKVLDIIKDKNKWCVEFGSWDGRKCSNTYNLIQHKNYSAVLIECNPRKFKDLLKTFQGNTKVHPINTFVGFEDKDCLDAILKRTNIPADFDILSIDIDGNDFHVWERVREYKPKVVVIEFNPSIPNKVEFVQPRDIHVTQGSSILSITKLAKSKGYELIAATKVNAIFVDSKYFGLFDIADNSVDSIRTDDSLITHIFCGFDGTIFIRGCCEIPWRKISYKESKVQQLPGWACKRVGDTNMFRRKLSKIYRNLRKNKKYKTDIC